MTDATLTKSLKQPVPFGSQLVLAMAAAALAPMIVLISVGYAFFYDDPSPKMSFEYWSFLVVIWVLGIAFLIARLLAGGLMKQLDSLATAATGVGEARSTRAAAGVASKDFSELEEKFNQIEAVVAEGRASSLGKISELEEEVAGLREAAELQAQFLSAISHEIRTPLSAIVSSARIIQRYHDKKPEVVGRFGDTIVTEGNRLVGTIGDMLDLVKIEAGQLEWRDGEVRADAVVARVTDHAAALAGRHQVAFATDVATALPVVRGDDQRIVQALRNIVTNAVKFTPTGGRIELTARESADGGLTFSVKDTGVGIEPGEIASIFEKSHVVKARKEKSVKQAGTGLGLALCREIVHHHGGVIWAESRVGEGSEFTFTLPPAADEHGMSHFGATDGQPIKALMLVKNSVLSDCALRALRLEDIDARVCTSMQEFFAALLEWTPDVVVVSPSFAWQLGDSTEQRIRKAGVSHILMFSHKEGFVELSPPTHSEPLLAGLSRIAAHGSTVLLVEDDEEYGAVIEFELLQAGYDVVKAYNGLDAVEIAVDQCPDAIVLDLALPQLDGFGVLESLEERSAMVPTVVLTSLDDESLDERLAQLGAADVFRKYELVQARTDGAAARVKKVLTPVLASEASEAADEAGSLPGA